MIQHGTAYLTVSSVRGVASRSFYRITTNGFVVVTYSYGTYGMVPFRIPVDPVNFEFPEASARAGHVGHCELDTGKVLRRASQADIKNFGRLTRRGGRCCVEKSPPAACKNFDTRNKRATAQQPSQCPMSRRQQNLAQTANPPPHKQQIEQQISSFCQQPAANESTSSFGPPGRTTQPQQATTSSTEHS